MQFKLSPKAIFITLIILLTTILISNYINRNKQLNSEKIKDIDLSKEGKTIGVNIEQNQPNGDRIKIFADLMEENKEKNRIKLINPITKIIKENNVTKITSEHGYIINNYKKFELDKDVNIYNNNKKFILKLKILQECLILVTCIQIHQYKFKSIIQKYKDLA